MTYEQLKKLVELMSNRKLIFSNQYGMLFILSEDNEILLNVTSLVEHDSASLQRLGLTSMTARKPHL